MPDRHLRERMKAAIEKEAREDRGDTASAVYGGMADAALSTLTLADHIAAVEAGGTHVVVPVEPTEEIVHNAAGCLADHHLSRLSLGEIMANVYRASLAARPRDAGDGT